MTPKSDLDDGHLAHNVFDPSLSIEKANNIMLLIFSLHLDPFLPKQLLKSRKFLPTLTLLTDGIITVRAWKVTLKSFLVGELKMTTCAQNKVAKSTIKSNG